MNMNKADLPQFSSPPLSSLPDQSIIHRLMLKYWSNQSSADEITALKEWSQLSSEERATLRSMMNPDSMLRTMEHLFPCLTAEALEAESNSSKSSDPASAEKAEKDRTSSPSRS
jgi:hypothetical protein